MSQRFSELVATVNTKATAYDQAAAQEEAATAAAEEAERIAAEKATVAEEANATRQTAQDELLTAAQALVNAISPPAQTARAKR